MTKTPRKERFCIRSSVVRFNVVTASEQKRYAPYSGEGDDGINYTRDHRFRTSADPSYEVKLEKSDQTPVERADYGENQSDSVYYHRNLRLSKKILLINSTNIVTRFLNYQLPNIR